MPEIIRCPMCGKENPAHTEICQFCQARIKPVSGGLKPPPGEEVDWLRDLSAVDETAPHSEIPQDSAPAADDSFLLDRLRSSALIEQTPAPPVEDEPFIPIERNEEGNADWLNILEESSARKEKGVPDLPAGELPDLDSWLDTLDQKGNAQPEQPAPENGLGKTAPRRITDRLSENVAETEAELPDWLNHLRTEPDELHSESAAPQSPPPFTSTSPDEEDELPPDWLHTATPFSTGFTGSLAQLQPLEDDEDEAEAPAQAADLPDWLQEISPFAPTEGQSGEGLPPMQGAEESYTPAFHGFDLPQGFESEAQPVEPPAEPFLPLEGAPFASPFVDEDLPDWTMMEETPQSQTWQEPAADAEPDATEETPEPTAHPFAEDSMPDWLETGEIADLLPQGQPGESEDELTPADLPGWLTAMRPVETVVPETQASLDEHIEKSGPLAGLRGILPADRQTIQYRKPPIYSTRLKVSENQASHAGLLEDLLRAENKPRSTKRENLQGSKRLMQLVVAVVLILVLVVFKGAGNLIDSPGRPYLMPYVMPFHSQIENLATGSPVLVAVDYDPGYAGELKAASNTAIQRLMHNQQRLAVISGVPAGPALAEDLLQTAYYSQHTIDPGFSLNTNTINLGYLPGGITSLKEFALRPQQAARYGLTSTYGGLIPWDHPALQGVSKLTDFGMLIVITDSVDSGRAWVEQVQPFLGGVPMLLISSAQAAPMLEPYVQSGQVQGMISGLAGSVAYENVLQQPGAGLSNWIAFQGGIAVIIALILVGILLQLFVILFASRKAKEA